MTGKRRGVADFIRWVDLDAPDWVVGIVVLLLVAAGIVALLTWLTVLGLAFRLHAWLGWAVLAATIWYGPIRLGRYVWHLYQQDTTDA